MPVSMPLAMHRAARRVRTEDELKRLNPQLRRGRTPPSESGYIVRVPAGAKAEFGRKLAELESEWGGYDAYVVRARRAVRGRRDDVRHLARAAARSSTTSTDEAEHRGRHACSSCRASPRSDRAKNQAKAKAKLLGSGVDQRRTASR